MRENGWCGRTDAGQRQGHRDRAPLSQVTSDRVGHAELDEKRQTHARNSDEELVDAQGRITLGTSRGSTWRSVGPITTASLS